MMTWLLRLVLLAVPGCTVGWQLAYADIYTWVDAYGSINVSNVAPPEGVHVTKVTHESPSKNASRPDGSGDASRQAEVQALAERVRELEHEIDVSRNQAPTIEYHAAPAPPPVPYRVSVPPSPVPYALNPLTEYPVESTQPNEAGCDPAWTTCWWGQPVYLPSIIVLRAPRFHQLPSSTGHHHFGVHPPVSSVHPPMSSVHGPMSSHGGFRRHS